MYSSEESEIIRVTNGLPLHGAQQVSVALWVGSRERQVHPLVKSFSDEMMHVK